MVKITNVEPSVSPESLSGLKSPDRKFLSLEDWRREAIRLFGRDPMKWRFICPSCGHVASVQDWKDAGAPEGTIAFSCVGRWLGKKEDAFQKGKSPCNYAGGGLFRINPVSVTIDGTVHKYFDFAPLT